MARIRRTQLGLDHLLGSVVAHLYYAFVIPLARLRNAEDVAPRGDVREHDLSGAADARPAFVINVDLGADRSKDDEPRTALRCHADIHGRLFELIHPGCN